MFPHRYSSLLYTFVFTAVHITVYFFCWSISIAPTFAQTPGGIYIGYEEMCRTDSAGVKHCYGDEQAEEMSENIQPQPKGRWYRCNRLRIAGDSLWLEQYPRLITDAGDTLASASDGGFYNRRGEFFTQNDRLMVRMRIVSCRYCGVPVQRNPVSGTMEPVPWPEEIYPVRFVDNELIIGEVRYRRRTDATTDE